MLKFILILIIIFMSLLTCFILLNKNPKVQDKIIQDYNPSLINDSKPILSNNDNIEIIKEMNYKNSLIKNFSCEMINAYTSQTGIKLKLTGSFAYQKDKFLNLELNFLLGKEFIMGSNDEEFWFWSKRLKPPSLYYANHKDFYNTRLKSAFNPIMIMDSLGFKEIPYEGIDIVEKESNIILVEKGVNSLGQPIGQMTFIDKNLKKIVGFLVTDDKGKMIASSQVVEYKNDLPYQILYNWYEEDRSMIIEFPSAVINTEIDFKNWIKPSLENSLDIGKKVIDLKWENE